MLSANGYHFEPHKVFPSDTLPERVCPHESSSVASSPHCMSFESLESGLGQEIHAVNRAQNSCLCGKLVATFRKSPDISASSITSQILSCLDRSVSNVTLAANRAIFYKTNIAAQRAQDGNAVSSRLSDGEIFHPLLNYQTTPSAIIVRFLYSSC